MASLHHKKSFRKILFAVIKRRKKWKNSLTAARETLCHLVNLEWGSENQFEKNIFLISSEIFFHR